MPQRYQTTKLLQPHSNAKKMNNMFWQYTVNNFELSVSSPHCLDLHSKWLCWCPMGLLLYVDRFKFTKLRYKISLSCSECKTKTKVLTTINCTDIFASHLNQATADWLQRTLNISNKKITIFLSRGDETWHFSYSRWKKINWQSYNNCPVSNWVTRSSRCDFQ